MKDCDLILDRTTTAGSMALASAQGLIELINSGCLVPRVELDPQLRQFVDEQVEAANRAVARILSNQLHDVGCYRLVVATEQARQTARGISECPSP